MDRFQHLRILDSDSDSSGEYHRDAVPALSTSAAAYLSNQHTQSSTASPLRRHPHESPADIKSASLSVGAPEPQCVYQGNAEPLNSSRSRTISSAQSSSIKRRHLPVRHVAAEQSSEGAFAPNSAAPPSIVVSSHNEEHRHFARTHDSSRESLCEVKSGSNGTPVVTAAAGAVAVALPVTEARTATSHAESRTSSRRHKGTSSHHTPMSALNSNSHSHSQALSEHSPSSRSARSGQTSSASGQRTGHTGSNSLKMHGDKLSASEETPLGGSSKAQKRAGEEESGSVSGQRSHTNSYSTQPSSSNHGISHSWASRGSGSVRAFSSHHDSSVHQAVPNAAPQHSLTSATTHVTVPALSAESAAAEAATAPASTEEVKPKKTSVGCFNFLPFCRKPAKVAAKEDSQHSQQPQLHQPSVHVSVRSGSALAATPDAMAEAFTAPTAATALHSQQGEHAVSSIAHSAQSRRGDDLSLHSISINTYPEADVVQVVTPANLESASAAIVSPVNFAEPAAMLERTSDKGPIVVSAEEPASRHRKRIKKRVPRHRDGDKSEGEAKRATPVGDEEGSEVRKEEESGSAHVDVHTSSEKHSVKSATFAPVSSHRTSLQQSTDTTNSSFPSSPHVAPAAIGNSATPDTEMMATTRSHATETATAMSMRSQDGAAEQSANSAGAAAVLAPVLHPTTDLTRKRLPPRTFQKVAQERGTYTELDGTEQAGLTEQQETCISGKSNREEGRYSNESSTFHSSLHDSPRDEAEDHGTTIASLDGVHECAYDELVRQQEAEDAALLRQLPPYQRRILLDLRARERREAEDLVREWRDLTFRPEIHEGKHFNIVNAVHFSERLSKSPQSGSPSTESLQPQQQPSPRRLTPSDEALVKRLYRPGERGITAFSATDKDVECTFRPEISESAKQLGRRGDVVDRLYKPRERQQQPQQQPRAKLPQRAEQPGDSETVFERLYRQSPERRQPRSADISPSRSPSRTMHRRDAEHSNDDSVDVFARLQRQSPAKSHHEHDFTSPVEPPLSSFHPQITALAQRQTPTRGVMERLYPYSESNRKQHVDPTSRKLEESTASVPETAVAPAKGRDERSDTATHTNGEQAALASKLSVPLPLDHYIGGSQHDQVEETIDRRTGSSVFA